MKVTFNDGRVFEVDMGLALTNVEAMAVERATGWDSAEVQERLNNGSALAFTALVWAYSKRQEPTLRFDDVVFDMDAVEHPAAAEEAPGPTGPPAPAEPEDLAATTAHP